MLDNVLLVDDDSITNFIHTKILERAKAAKTVKAVLGAEEGLKYLSDCVQNKTTLPAVILLDINMPMMNGWEFVEAFNKLPEDVQKEIHIFFLTTSQDPVEIERARKLKPISGFLFKPLDLEGLKRIYSVLNIEQ